MKLIRTNISKVLQFIRINLPSVNGTSIGPTYFNHPLAQLILIVGPGGGGFELFFARGVENSPIKKLPGVLLGRGDGQAWNRLIHKQFMLTLHL